MSEPSQPESTKRCDICGREKMRGSDPRANQCNPAYMTSAAAFHRLSYERVSRALAEAEKDAQHWRGTAIRTAEDLARSADRLAEAETLKRISDSQAHEAWIERDGALARLAEAEKERDEAREHAAEMTGLANGSALRAAEERAASAEHDAGTWRLAYRSAEERAAQAERDLRAILQCCRDGETEHIPGIVKAALSGGSGADAPQAPPGQSCVRCGREWRSHSPLLGHNFAPLSDAGAQGEEK